MDANAQQLAFAEAFVAGGGNGTQAAIAAGYSPHSARQQSSRLLTIPHVQQAIRFEHGKVLRSRLATKALDVLEGILDDPGAPPGARVDAAKTILDRAGLPAMRTQPDEEPETVPLSQMSLAQLDAHVRTLALRVAKAKGKIIDIPAVDSQPNTLAPPLGLAD